MLLNVCIQHKLGERTMQTRDLAVHYDIARTTNLCCGLKVQPTALCQIHMILRLKSKASRCTPDTQLLIISFILSLRHNLVW